MNNHDHHVRVYLQALAALSSEVADRPWLLPWFVRIIALVPTTIMELNGKSRRLAA
jgi:hypothetical protein